MAVKPLTNWYPKRTGKRTGEYNRATDLSTRDFKNRAGNLRDSRPTNNFINNFSTTLKDIDSCLMNHIKHVMGPTLKVRERGETVSIPIYYGNEERWANIQKHGALRDRNGSLILPLIIVKRTDTSMNTEMPLSFDHDVEGKYIHVVRTKKWSEKNRYDNFAIQTNTKPSYESIVTGMPDFVVCNYQIVSLTNYMEQMNDLNALWIEHVETYWGGSIW